jgi:hemerythrin
VFKYQEDFESEKVIMTVQLLHFLKNWLEHHIQESDMAYAPYLKSRAVA